MKKARSTLREASDIVIETEVSTALRVAKGFSVILRIGWCIQRKPPLAAEVQRRIARGCTRMLSTSRGNSFFRAQRSETELGTV